MQDTKNFTFTLNPEIKSKAKELFSLLEAACDQGHCDYTFDALVREMGDLLQDSHGFQELLWAYRATLPKSKEASWDLEEVSQKMDDDALGKLQSLIRYSELVTDALNHDGDKEINTIGLTFKLDKLAETAASVRGQISHEWQLRAEGYRAEIEEMKMSA